jgi:two-component system sensor kinase FixL
MSTFPIALARRIGLFVMAALLVLFMAAVRYQLDDFIGDRVPYLLFVLPILAATIWLGTAPAMFAAVWSVLFGMYFSRINHVSAFMAALEGGAFTLTALGILLLGRSIRNARDLAVAHNAGWRDAAQELDLLIDGARDHAIYMIDVNGAVVIWNRGAERLKGWTESEVLGRHFSIFYPQAAIAAGKPQQDLQRALAEGKFSAEGWRVRKDGSQFLSNVSMACLVDDIVGLRGFALIDTDITNIRAAENEAREREEHLRSIIETVPDAVVVADEGGMILSFNPTAERLFGYTERELLGSNVRQLMPAADRMHHDGDVRRYHETGERRIIGVGREVRGARKDGSTFPMKLEIAEASAGERIVFTAFIHDLTGEQLAQETIRHLQAELMHAARLKAMGTMASTLAHELNQPMTAVAFYIDAVRDMLADPDRETREVIQQVLDDAATEAQRAGQIVRRIRAFVAHGDTDRSIVALPALVSEAAGLALVGVGPLSVETRFALHSETTPVIVDAIQIQQVLVNLVRNALEAMAESVLRQLTIISQVDGPRHVRISVADTGSGIDPAIAPRLFSAFTTSKEEGMGLGLSICRTIIEAHGGKIWAEARPGGGSVFHFTVLRAEVDEDEQHGG